MFAQKAYPSKNVVYDWHIYVCWKVEDLKYYLGRCGLKYFLLPSGGIASDFRLLCCKVCMHTWKLSSHQWQSRLFLSVTNDCADYSTSGAGFELFKKISCGYVQTASLETFLDVRGNRGNKEIIDCHCLCLHISIYSLLHFQFTAP